MSYTRYTVDVYKASGIARKLFRTRSIARRYARKQWTDPDVYKVNVWKGDPVPNVPDHERLILRLV